MSSGFERLPFALEHDALVGACRRSRRHARRLIGARRSARRRASDPKRISSSGWTWIWIERLSPPNTATLATPGTARSRGRTVHSAAVRSSISERVREVRPTTSMYAGRRGQRGHDRRRDALRQLLGRRRQPLGDDLPVPIDVARGSKNTVMTETPWIELERSVCTPGTPLMAFSIGRVTRTSTCSGRQPTAFGLDADLGGANSGKTSYLARPSA